MGGGGVTAPPRPPTILDVAAAASVSKSVVSRVLRGQGKVSEESRRAVQEAVHQLGYQPNRAARSLKERVPSVVGMVAGDLRNPYYVDILNGVYAAADAVRHRVIVASGHDALGGEEAAIRTLLEFQVAGLILTSPTLSMAALRRMTGEVPVAVEGRSDAPARFDVVTSDDADGAAQVVDHLVRLGHTRILVLTDHSASGADRREGLDQALRAAGHAKTVMHRQAPATADGGYRAMRQVLRLRRLPTAVAAGNDVVAFGVMSAINEAGLSVPDDISVTGFDDIEMAGLRQFDLTTVRQDRAAIGRTCFDVVHRRANHPDQHRAGRAIFSPSLVVRGSTGPAER